MGSAGGVVAQPVLGRVADISGYGPRTSSRRAIHAIAIPFIVLSRREHAVSDPITSGVPLPVPEPTLPGA